MKTDELTEELIEEITRAALRGFFDDKEGFKIMTSFWPRSRAIKYVREFIKTIETNQQGLQ